MKPIVLEDGRIRAAFDADTGALMEFRDKETSWDIISRGEFGLSFRLLVPLPDRRNNPVDGIAQKPPSVKVRGDGRGLEMAWDKLRSRFGGMHDITFRASIALEDGKLVFRATVVNRSEYTVEYACFPCLGEVSMPPGEEQVNCLWPGSYMEKIPLMPRFIGRGDYFGHDNPTLMLGTPEAPFVLACGAGKGLYAGCHETEANELVQFIFTVKPGLDRVFGIGNGTFTPGTGLSRLEFAACSFVFASPGETKETSPLVLAPYTGSWHRGADIYKEWRKTWFKRPLEPAWSQDIHSWQQFGINSPEDELRCQYRDLPTYGKDCAKHGVKAIQLTGWNAGGQDRNNPSHDTDPRLGTAEELKQAIREIQAMGVKMVLFNKFTWADRSTERFRKELLRLAVKDPYGDYYVYSGYQYQTVTQMSDINTRRLVPMCMMCTDWRKAAEAEFVKSLDLGADGILYDEAQHHGNGRYCFDRNHGHRIPAFVFAGDTALMDGFRRIAEERNPGFLFSGEALYDRSFGKYHVSYFRIMNPAHFPVQRYVDPHAGIMVAVTGYNDRDTLNQCLLYRYIASYEPLNFKGRLDEFPLTIEYGKRMDALRRRYRKFLWDGEFRGTQDARVVSGGKPHEWFSVFADPATGKRAVVLANFEAREGEFEVEMRDGARNLVVATPEEQEPGNCGGKIKLGPSSSAVLMEE